jgi:ATP-dependent DNA helicase RecG
MTHRSPDYLRSLLRELISLPRETEWVEFKVDNTNPQEIGEYISALANAAALNGKVMGCLVWGVENGSHRVVGTRFDPLAEKKGNEPLESWLLRLLDPRIRFSFHPVDVDGVRVVLLEIEPAVRQPVRFSGTEYIRIGEVKKPLKDAPDRERALWRTFDTIAFEDRIALERVGVDEMLRLLDWPTYFKLLGQTVPTNRSQIVDALSTDRMIQISEAGGWDITNLGALLLATELAAFDRLARKAIRVIQYRGKTRMNTQHEQLGIKGYASGFEGLLGYINGLVPQNEIIGEALRKRVPMFPPLAIRELVANALIHQDLSVSGAGPTIELFDDRMEITNPGRPLLDTQRLVDLPPRSRNERLASRMRRFGICEERGTGIDKVLHEIEAAQLPAPLFEVPDDSMRVVLFAHMPLSAMGKADKLRACYLHACLCHVNHQDMTNTTLRKRFGVEVQNRSIASRLIREAVNAGLIAPADADAAPKQMKYVPFWAASQ